MFLIDLLITKYASLIVHGLLIFGVIAYFVSKYAGVYRFIATPVSIVIIILAVFLQGNFYAMRQYNKEIAEYQEKIRVAEEQSSKVNTVVQTKVVEKIKVVKDTTNANVQVIEKVVTKYDNLCTLSNAAISLHNAASQNEVSRSTGNTVEGTSNVKASELLTTVTENYGTFYQMREQLLGWQQWYKEQRKIYESVK